MKRNDYIFIFISILSSTAFCIVSFLQLQPNIFYSPESPASVEFSTQRPSPQLQERQHRQHRYRRGKHFAPTGKPFDVEKIKTMIQRGELSNKEALFYKPLNSIENNEGE